MSPETEHTKPRHGYTHVHVTLTQYPSATWPAGRGAADGDVSFAFTVAHGPETVPVTPPDGRDADPALGNARLVDELLGCAADAPRETVDRLLASHDVHAARLGRAVRAVQQALGTERNTAGSPHSPHSDAAAIDPVTHDPAW
ncbi:hypothetical protein AB0I68_08995 [Streptomyces sp. NPDC050448]|uniref:hypothetical protein n=1 Tax=Streptomyces sp. NPDC050448 TaxID=3155404 RepID=UPI00343EF5BA